MFNTNKDYLNEDVQVGGSVINKSGCYEMMITDANIFKSKTSQSEALNLSFMDTETEKKAWKGLFYKNKNGEDVKFVIRNLTHLEHLLNVNPVADKDGNIPVFVNKIIGVFLEVKGEINYKDEPAYEFNVVGFYDPSTKQTAKEKINNSPAEAYYKAVEKYKDAEEVVLPKLDSQKPLDNIEGFYDVSNDDLPF